MKVFKYILTPAQVGQDIHVEVPIIFKVVHFAEQHGALCMWALLNPDSPKEDGIFRIYGTGQDIPEDCAHEGTCFQRGGDLVWHLFRVWRD